MKLIPTMHDTPVSTQDWSLRNLVLAATRRWPLIVLFFLVGALLGWGVSWIVPSPYRANHELYVGLNIYRWYLDRNVVKFAGNMPFNSPDDYKNWQMANLNALVLGGDVLSETLNRLAAQDPYWGSVTVPQMAAMADLYWRNPGSWRMVVQAKDSRLAAQAVDVWQHVALERLEAAVSASQDLIAVDAQIQALAQGRVAATQRLAALGAYRTALQGWLTPASDATLTPLQHWQVWSLLAQSAGDDTDWKQILAAIPAAASPPAAYRPSIEQALAAIDAETASLHAQIATLDAQEPALQQQYAKDSQDSMGFSPNLEVKPASGGPPRMETLRPGALLALVGAVIGMLAWAITWIARIALEARR